MARISCSLLIVLWASVAVAAEPRHQVVFADKGTFAGWPANGGLWVWDDGQEVVMLFITGAYELRSGHNLKEPYTNRLARTRDGGKSWTIENPATLYQPKTVLKPLDRAIDFTRKDLMMRVISEGYHGGGPEKGSIQLSNDRGKTWEGPFNLPELLPKDKAMGRDQITSRTDYISLGSNECLLMASVRPTDRKQPDRAFAVKLTEGGKKAEFLNWLQPNDEPHRTIMCSTVRLVSGELITTVRVRQFNEDVSWVDCYSSKDTGQSWQHLAKVGNTGKGNGNPPALVLLRDGRLCCAYGDRTRQRMYARISDDSGKSWGNEIILREGYQPDALGDVDFGYPRMFQRPDGDLVTCYYYATPEMQTNFIAATIWTPPSKE